LAVAALAFALTACDSLPNSIIGGETLHGEVSGKVTAKTKIAVTSSVPVDFSQATIVSVSNGKFSYKLPDSEANLHVAAFEDEDGNGRWNGNEPITYGGNDSSYLKLSKINGTWQVTEYTAGVPKSASLADTTIINA
jgi:hypothetical protein